MGLDANFKEAKVALKLAKLDLDITKMDYSSKKKKTKEQKEKCQKPTPSSEAASSPLAVAKTAYDRAMMAIEVAKLAITTDGVKDYELYGNLLSNKARQQWEKVIKAQVTHAPCKDVYRIMHTEIPTTTTFHLQQVFQYNLGETLN